MDAGAADGNSTKHFSMRCTATGLSSRTFDAA
jgi:hypothetical protein